MRIDRSRKRIRTELIILEIWDLYDQDRNLTGETGVRGEPLPKGRYHLVVHVCIFNSKGEMLIQQRQPFKKGWPNLWDVSVGGSACQGENSTLAAERETLEELGLQLDLSGQRPFLTICFEGGFDDIYLIQQDVEISRLHLQEEEVQAVQWATLEQVEQMMTEGVFIPYHKGLLPLLFAMHRQRGAIRL